MAGIDGKIVALAFTTISTRPHDRIEELIGDAAQIARAKGSAVNLSEGDGRVNGIVKNDVGATLAKFSLTLDTDAEGRTTVTFGVDDYLRTRDTVLTFLPVSPWDAPAFMTLRAFSDYLREKLQVDTAWI